MRVKSCKTDAHVKAADLLQVVAFLAIAAFGLIYFTSIWGFITMRATNAQKFVAAAGCVGITVFLIFVSIGIRARSQWARNSGIVFGTLTLIAFPIGTFIGGYLLMQLIVRWEPPDECCNTDNGA